MRSPSGQRLPADLTTSLAAVVLLCRRQDPVLSKGGRARSNPAVRRFCLAGHRFLCYGAERLRGVTTEQRAAPPNFDDDERAAGARPGWVQRSGRRSDRLRMSPQPCGERIRLPRETRSSRRRRVFIGPAPFSPSATAIPERAAAAAPAIDEDLDTPSPAPLAGGQIPIPTPHPPRASRSRDFRPLRPTQASFGEGAATVRRPAQIRRGSRPVPAANSHWPRSTAEAPVLLLAGSAMPRLARCFPGHSDPWWSQQKPAASQRTLTKNR